MEQEEYQRLICRMNETMPDDDAALFISLKGDEVKISTFGAPRPLTRLKQWVYKWLGGRDL